jgi:putative DNA primase/helicase
MTPSAFLTTLWGDVPPSWVLIWTVDPFSGEKHSIWVKVFDHVDRIVQGQTSKNVYMGCSLAPDTQQVPSSRVRVRSDNSAGIAGLWADIDIAHEVHQKQNLPATVEAALEALPQEHPPSIVVHSGHGLQCWWLYVQPWIFKDAHERRLAQQQTQKWHGILADAFHQKGYTLDATHDLARVMRLPGTWNHKAPERKPVQVIQTSDFRWRDFPNLLNKNLPTNSQCSPFLTRATPPVEVGSLNLDPEQPLPAVCEIMLENMEKFARTWQRKRSDLASASEFDMSIAGNGVAAGCTDQEIAAMIIHFRARQGYDLDKIILRQDYIRRTIARARGVEYHA